MLWFISNALSSTASKFRTGTYGKWGGLVRWSGRPGFKSYPHRYPASGNFSFISKIRKKISASQRLSGDQHTSSLLVGLHSTSIWHQALSWASVCTTVDKIHMASALRKLRGQAWTCVVLTWDLHNLEALRKKNVKNDKHKSWCKSEYLA